MAKVKKESAGSVPENTEAIDQTVENQPSEIIAPEEINEMVAETESDEPQESAPSVTVPEKSAEALAEEQAIANAEAALLAKQSVSVDHEILDSIVERNEYTVVFIVNHAPLKIGDERTVSGNVAKSLIKKGLVELK